ncbi:hypothetical protein [Pseudalkalibacillus berkeleyi]|uniref:Uncharacterized protein n=1 Tax=Pseudalkalibacillus berkeleyi TaxID=1069813 RepID=A0ABS9H3B6_9BACL|nr:hypothetical protein [Pseudalkalibacillus berkeleyi]MCF6138293.1 hypothetical protein [Pseudalkalibacillus berkeleyi]
MPERSNRNIFIGILICLIFIALKPVPSLDVNQMPDNHSHDSYQVVDEGERVVQLGENRIAIIETKLHSGNRGDILILEFNEEKKIFEKIGKDNYLEDFHMETWSTNGKESEESR